MAGEPGKAKLLLCVLNNKHFNVNDCAAGSRQSQSESILFIHYTNLIITSAVTPNSAETMHIAKQRYPIMCMPLANKHSTRDRQTFAEQRLISRKKKCLFIIRRFGTKAVQSPSHRIRYKRLGLNGIGVLCIYRIFGWPNRHGCNAQKNCG